jgi:hypothetical protein
LYVDAGAVVLPNFWSSACMISLTSECRHARLSRNAAQEKNNHIFERHIFSSTPTMLWFCLWHHVATPDKLASQFACTCFVCHSEQIPAKRRIQCIGFRDFPGFFSRHDKSVPTQNDKKQIWGNIILSRRGRGRG